MARRVRLAAPIKLALCFMFCILCYVCMKIFQFTNAPQNLESNRRVYDGQSRSDILPVLPQDNLVFVHEPESNDANSNKVDQLKINMVQEFTEDNEDEDESEEDSDYSDSKKNLDHRKNRYSSSIPVYPFEVQKCPACFGDSLCQSFSNGDAHLNLTIKRFDPNSIDYHGYYRHTRVVGKRLGSNDEFQKLDNFICANTSQDINCDVGDAVVMSYLASDTALTVHHFRNELWKVTQIARSDLSATICATKRFIDTIKSLYNHDKEGILNEEERSQLMTSLILNPEGILLKFFMEADFAENTVWPVPFYIGECGRVIITEHTGRPLRHFFGDSWSQRVNLSLQLLDMVNKFLKEDSDWLVLLGDFHHSNFAVTDSGRLVLTNLKDVLIVDKYESRPYGLQVGGEINYDRPCNEECFGAFIHKLLKDPTHQCQETPFYAQLMYSLVCRWLLSANQDHKKMTNDNPTEDPDEQQSFDAQQRLDDRFSPGGLLHSIPEEHEESIHELIEECISETSFGGRLSAVEEMIDLLQEIQYTA
ncbi:divergent protein kinase domain 2A-like [Ptychodera flava]|uniref:divergent protein kinase domain 2A-like n=1 Tax=Ptychodera flava TaxID=63121 RepID=UPI00396A3C1B